MTWLPRRSEVVIELGGVRNPNRGSIELAEVHTDVLAATGHSFPSFLAITTVVQELLNLGRSRVAAITLLLHRSSPMCERKNPRVSCGSGLALSVQFEQDGKPKLAPYCEEAIPITFITLALSRVCPMHGIDQNPTNRPPVKTMLC